MAATFQELEDIKEELGYLETALRVVVASAETDGVIDDDERADINEFERNVITAKKKRDELEAALAAVPAARGLARQSETGRCEARSDHRRIAHTS